MTTTAARLLLAVVLAAAACASDAGPDRDAAATSTTAGSSSSPPSAPTPPTAPSAPDDAVWVLGDPGLTFTRVGVRRSVPLGAPFEDEAPIVEGSRLLLEYRTTGGGAVYVEQGALVDPSTELANAVDPGGGGLGPVLATVVGTSRVVISAPAEDLRPVAATLEPITPADLDAMVDGVSARIIDAGPAEDVVDGVTFHRDPTSGDQLACLDGREPDACALAGRYGPLVMAPSPVDDTFTVVGCIDQPIPITEVLVGDRPIATQAAPCGQAFSVPGLAAGTLAITFDDGPGGVGTYTFDLPS